MPQFVYQGLTINYKTIGHGQPLLILNGVLMSMASWKAFEKAFSASNKLIMLDFVDQGNSSRMTEPYTQQLQVEVVEALLAHLGETKVNIMGISYGGEVALQYALKYGHRIRRLVLANTTSRTSSWLRDIGLGWNEVGESGNGLAYYYIAIPVIYSTNFYENNIEWMDNRKKVLSELFNDKVVMNTFKRLVDSAENYNVADRLSEISCPTLIISGSEDCLTPIYEQRILSQGISNSEWITIDGCGHASMYEKPQLFASIVLGYVNNIDDDIVV